MRFRRQPPALEPRPYRVPRPWNRPETEFPGLVPIDSLLFEHSDQAAIAVTGISAYTNGFEFAVTRLIQPEAPGWDGGLVPTAPRDWRSVDRAAEISLQLSDGRKVLSERPHDDSEPTRPMHRAAVAALRTTSSRAGGHGRCRPAECWNLSASGRHSGSRKRASASMHN